MEKIGVLNLEQAKEYQDFFDFKHRNLTQFAMELGAEYYVKTKYEGEDDCVCKISTSTIDFDITERADMAKSIKKGSLLYGAGGQFYIYSRKACYIPFLNSNILPYGLNKTKIDNRYAKVYFGRYPQKYVSVRELNLSETDKFFRINKLDTDKSNWYTPFEPNLLKVYKDISSNRDFVNLENVYYEVLPIEWILDESNGIMFSDKVLFSGISFAPTNRWDGNKKSSELYNFVENYFLDDILQYEKNYNSSLTPMFDYTKENKKLISEAKKQGKEELKKFYDSLEEKMLKTLFGENEKELKKLSKSVYDKANLEIKKNLEDYNKKSIREYETKVEDISKNLEAKFNEFINSSKDKELAYENVKKKFDELAKEEVKEKVNPIVDEEIKKLEKIKCSLVKDLSQTARDSFLEFKEQIDKVIININKLTNDLDNKEKILNKSIENIDKELDRINERKNKVEEEITKDVIKQVVDLNPVREINIIIDNVKKNSIKGLFHKDFEAILQLVALKMPVFLVGPTGCGKNVILKQCAKVLDKTFFYQNDANEDHKLLGFIDANGIYHPTPFYKAFKEGGLLMLDEMDNSNASVLLKLNSAIGSGNDFYMTFPNGETVNANKDFQVVAAANTFGAGADALYVGRNQIDGASLDRYFTYHLDYDKTLEKSLVNNKDILPLFWEVRRIIEENDIRHTVSTRGILNMDSILSSNIIGKGTFTLGTAFDGTLIKGLDIEDLSTIVSKITTTDYYTKEFLKHLKDKYKVTKDEYNNKNVNNERYSYNDGYNSNYDPFGFGRTRGW